ncbi:MAG: ABC transporter ATP-binding protein, partial [Actinomycetota bacterium]|nr:ABC transporter ATP-binding protein [Actinomycetota bacterium]
MIVVERLKKIYGGVPAVQDLSFHVGPGEIVGLVGPNGAGKTTTLRCLAGIVRPTEGRVAIAGHDLAGASVDAKRRLAFVPDEPDLFEHLTVEEHLAFVARLYQVPDPEPLAAELLAELELGARRQSFPGELSRGMRQKLAMACALLHRPAVLLLDEPLTG